jgi:hypothetical protein
MNAQLSSNLFSLDIARYFNETIFLFHHSKWGDCNVI